MPISQISKINQIESQPQEKIVESHPEKGSVLSPEVPKTEFGQDHSTKTSKPANKLPSPLVKSSTSSGLIVDQKFKKIEGILEEDLGEVYFNLSPEKKEEFKTKGEETTIKIISLLSKPKVKIKKIISLIRAWLRIIPGINVFFLEQEVKIKADKIIDEASRKN